MDTDVYPEFKWNKRIKVEHSYARETDQVDLGTVGEEDPLKIYPQDLDDIKKEAEDEETIIIKSEPDPDECENEKCDDGHEEKTLMEVVGSEPCESAESSFFLANLGLVNNCEVAIGEAQPDSNRANDVVPKMVFQEMQKMYEKAMADVTALNKKLATEKQKKLIQSSKNANNSKTLKNDIKKLKDQLTQSKNREQVLKRTLDISAHEDAQMKKSVLSMRSQLDDLLKKNRECNLYINDLKQSVQSKEEVVKNLRQSLKQQSKASIQKRKSSDQNFKKMKDLCAARESQRKELEVKCSLLSQTVVASNAKLTLQQKELEKVKLDIDIMDRSIIDSLKTRQSLKDQLTVIEKEFKEVKENPPMVLKLQEVQKSLIVANKRLDDTQRQLETEKKNIAGLLKEKQIYLKDHTSKLRDAEVQLNVLRVTVAALKKTARAKVEERRRAVEECLKLRQELERRKDELEQLRTEMQAKLEAEMAKQCEYCGF